MCDDWTYFNFVTLENAPKVSGVYFLMNDIELVYIGQSKNIRNRLGTHNSNWNNDIMLGDEPMFPDSFDSLYYLECDYKPERKAYEDMFKEDYSPKLNNYDVLRNYLEPKRLREQEERKLKELLGEEGFEEYKPCYHR